MSNLPKKSTKSELEEMSEKLSAMQDKHIRLIAEFDNYKKRTFKENRPNKICRREHSY
ncbi:MAG: nucleotide exchange factor GrpE [Bacteroidales bacterium]|nr:nucleotide exchange factor GrpE [Bacteroidales bacterium]